MEMKLPFEPEKLAQRLKLDSGVGFLARVLAGHATTVYEQVTKQTDITPQQFGVLLTLHQQGTITLTELTRSTRADRSTIGEMVRRMKDRGLIERMPGKDDRRTSLVSITEKGRTVLLDLLPHMPELQDRLLARIPAEERRLFLHHLKMILDV
jgi:DNA-binding MarR family transcriptional regulator